MCGGGGASGEESTGGMCWDCQGTGHPHLGPCAGFWLWWWRHASAVFMLLIVWLLLAGVVVLALALRDQVWPAYVFAGVTLAWWFGWLGLDVMYLRRFQAEAWNGVGEDERDDHAWLDSTEHPKGPKKRT